MQIRILLIDIKKDTKIPMWFCCVICPKERGSGEHIPVQLCNVSETKACSALHPLLSKWLFPDPSYCSRKPQWSGFATRDSKAPDGLAGCVRRGYSLTRKTAVGEQTEAWADARARSFMAQVGMCGLLGPREPREPNGIVRQGYFWYKRNEERERRGRGWGPVEARPTTLPDLRS